MSILQLYEIQKRLVVTWGETFETCHQRMMEESAKPLGLVNCLNYGHPGETLGDMKEFLEDLRLEYLISIFPVFPIKYCNISKYFLVVK